MPDHIREPKRVGRGAYLDGEMRRVAAFLNIDLPAARWRGVVERCTFERMRADADKVGNFSRLFEGGAKTFLFKGTNGRWREVLTEGELQRYRDRVEVDRLASMNLADDTAPAFSTDGKKVAFTSERSDNHDIWRTGTNLSQNAALSTSPYLTMRALSKVLQPAGLLRRASGKRGGVPRRPLVRSSVRGP